ncbi:MAG: MFS transporter [Chloroflexi bacterium]|nr:MFS transporter [Chloroflexota bacterium]
MLNPQRKIFFGWWVVAGAFTIDLFVGGTFSLGFTAFFKPLADEFGWSYFAISLAASIRGVEAGIVAPACGFLADKWGPRRTVMVGVAVMGAGLIMLSLTRSLPMFYMSFVIMSIGSGASSGIVMMAAVANWFDKKIGLAMGLMVAGFGAAGIMVPVSAWLIGAYGWRQALVILAVATWVIGLPAALLIRHKPEQYGYLPDGEQPDSKRDAKPAPEGTATGAARVKPGQVEASPGDALKSGAFWLISLSMGIRLLLTNAVAVHIMPYLIGIGFSQAAAAMVAALVPLFSIAGRLGLGWVGDIMDKRHVIAVSYALMAVGMYLFVFANVPWALVVFMLAFGIGNGGTVPMRAAIQREYFGRSAFGAIQGLIVAVMNIGGIVGAALAGWLYDNTGGYEIAWTSYAILGAASIPMILVARRPGKARRHLGKTG